MKRPIQNDLFNKISFLKKRKGNIAKIGIKTKKVFIIKANPIHAPKKKRCNGFLFLSNLMNEKRPIFTNKEKIISCVAKCAKLNHK